MNVLYAVEWEESERGREQGHLYTKLTMLNICLMLRRNDD